MSKKTLRRNPFPDSKARPAYQTPVVVALGELAKGTGACTNGGSDVGGILDCRNGAHPVGGTCNSGASFN